MSDTTQQETGETVGRTVSDNIRDMAALVKDVKRTFQLTETTVMRIVDMNIALHQQAQQRAQNALPDFDIPEGGEFPDLAALPEPGDDTPEEETE